MEKTGIIWTEKTWNPVTGCVKISKGCKYCYAETIANKYKGHKAFPIGFDLQYREHKLRDPFKWKEPSLIFVNSMSDMFWDKISDDYRNKIVDVIEQTPQHEYQVLTKRPANMLRYSKYRKLPFNFWAGTTIENVKSVERLEILKKVNAEIRFISFEPLIEELPYMDLSGIHWVITGGESGNHLWDQIIRKERGIVIYEDKKWKPDPMKIHWIRKIRDNCKDYGTHFFHKQWGGNYPEAAGRLLDGQSYNEMPRYPGMKTEINNEYLKSLEKQKEITFELFQ